MGKWAEANPERELMRKFSHLFGDVREKMRKENPDCDITFADFVTALDDNDRFTRRLFEFLIKETLSRARQTQTTTEPELEAVPSYYQQPVPARPAAAPFTNALVGGFGMGALGAAPQPSGAGPSARNNFAGMQLLLSTRATAGSRDGAAPVGGGSGLSVTLPGSLLTGAVDAPPAVPSPFDDE